IAPTPVSSLVHSSTLVTAGVYLLIRYKPIIINNYNEYLLLISRITIIISGLIANFECDFKKIIALSTLRQLGFIIRILFINIEKLAFIHLIIHAIFKSLIFLCTGRFIHYINRRQDIRDYRGIIKIHPLKRIIITFSILSLCGFPFLCGFYSKDLIIEYFFITELRLEGVHFGLHY
ncbi:NADH-ubiquinone oxidoreductase chain 5, partial [Habropoda laboriosa]